MATLRSRLLSLDLRFTAAAFGLIAQGVAWSCGIIALLLLTSKMPSIFHRVPPEIQFACEALVVLAAALLIRMLVERRRAIRAYAQLTEALAPYHLSHDERSRGISPEQMDRIRDACKYLSGAPQEWWLAVDDALEYYETSPSDGGWFLTRPVHEVLQEDELIGPFYHASFHQAVPGILTALGLLATFSAILIALSGVSYNAANTAEPVTGIDTLINGLAGKFLSSIVALILSMIFTFVEKKVCERQILQRMEGLRKGIGRLFPFLSQTRILLDLQRAAWALTGRQVLQTEADFAEVPVEETAAQPEPALGQPAPSNGQSTPPAEQPAIQPVSSDTEPEEPSPQAHFPSAEPVHPLDVVPLFETAIPPQEEPDAAQFRN
jgi:hypothetical protein